MIFINNKYTVIYYAIVNRAKNRTLTSKFENHHIIPESFFKQRMRKGPAGWIDGNPNDLKNLVKLTPNEHFICHKLLVKMTTGEAKKKMIFALWGMCRSSNNQTRKIITGKQYELLRTSFVNLIGQHNTGKRSPLTDKHKQKISETTKNKPKSEATKDAMVLAWETRDRTVKDSTRNLLKITSTTYWKSVDARETQSIKRKDFLKKFPNVAQDQVARINSTKICEHCKIEVNLGNYVRWHGDNCKLNRSL